MKFFDIYNRYFWRYFIVTFVLSEVILTLYIFNTWSLSYFAEQILKIRLFKTLFFISLMLVGCSIVTSIFVATLFRYIELRKIDVFKFNPAFIKGLSLVFIAVAFLFIFKFKIEPYAYINFRHFDSIAIYSDSKINNSDYSLDLKYYKSEYTTSFSALNKQIDSINIEIEKQQKLMVMDGNTSIQWYNKLPELKAQKQRIIKRRRMLIFFPFYAFFAYFFGAVFGYAIRPRKKHEKIKRLIF